MNTQIGNLQTHARPYFFGKSGVICPFTLPSNGYWYISRPNFVFDAERSEQTISHTDLKHNFTIKALAKPGMFRRRPYLYVCVRCHHAFIVNERRGSVVAVDGNLNPHSEPMNSLYVRTFADGPCPKLWIMKRVERQTVAYSRRRSRRFGLLGAVAAFLGLFERTVYTGEKTMRIPLPAAILPADLLF